MSVSILVFDFLSGIFSELYQLYSLLLNFFKSRSVNSTCVAKMVCGKNLKMLFYFAFQKVSFVKYNQTFKLMLTR